MMWLLLLTGLYFLLMVRWAMAWKRIPMLRNNEPGDLTVSVVTAMRNEAVNITELIDALIEQDLDHQQWDLILVDDHSTDNSIELAESALSASEINYRILQLPGSVYGKKAAVRFGVEHSGASWIFTTDADCTMGTSWLSAMVSAVDEKTKMITGPVQFVKGKSFVHRFVELDLISMIGIGASSLKTGVPLLNNAANMGFHRETFLEIDPYAHSRHASGDDIFLLKQIHRSYPGAIKFIKSRAAIVTTVPPASLSEFIQQRIRWASKTSSTLNTVRERMIVMLIYATNLVVLLVPLLLVITGTGKHGLFLAISNVLLKIGADMVFFRMVLPFFEFKNGLRSAFLSEILHIPYVVLFGLSGFRGTYQWKSRKLR